MKNERGNALFLILIAVALFAALSYAVTNSGRGGGGIDREQASLAASQIMQFGASVEQALLRMRISGSVPVSEMDFRSDQRTLENGTAQPFENSNCTTVDCQLFHAQGGGVTYQTFDQFASTAPWAGTSTARGHNDILIGNVEGLGSDLPELILRVFILDPEVCVEINRMAGLPANPTLNLTGQTEYRAVGDFTASLTATDAWTFDGDLAGKNQFCAGDPASYHMVVLAR
tara:strand:- start:51 stop:740 length:690 start_codon:yes stop_codon:yes gene_type:complete